jgi:hypothetical protein
LIGIALVLVLLRLNLRLRHLKTRLALCDYFILGAFVSACSLTVVDTWLHALKVYQANVNFHMDHWHPTDEQRIQVYKVGASSPLGSTVTTGSSAVLLFE